MTHEEYISRLTSLDDSPADSRAALRHVSNCGVCAREHRAVDRRLASLEGRGRSLAEAALRWGAAAGIVAILFLGSRSPAEKPAETAARYRIVGDASGVVAYTPGGVLVGTAATVSKNEVEVSR